MRTIAFRNCFGYCFVATYIIRLHGGRSDDSNNSPTDCDLLPVFLLFASLSGKWYGTYKILMHSFHSARGLLEFTMSSFPPPVLLRHLALFELCSFVYQLTHILWTSKHLEREIEHGKYYSEKPSQVEIHRNQLAPIALCSITLNRAVYRLMNR